GGRLQNYGILARLYGYCFGRTFGFVHRNFRGCSCVQFADVVVPAGGVAGACAGLVAHRYRELYICAWVVSEQALRVKHSLKPGVVLQVAGCLEFALACRQYASSRCLGTLLGRKLSSAFEVGV